MMDRTDRVELVSFMADSTARRLKGLRESRNSGRISKWEYITRRREILSIHDMLIWKAKHVWWKELGRKGRHY